MRSGFSRVPRSEALARLEKPNRQKTTSRKVKGQDLRKNPVKGGLRKKRAGEIEWSEGLYHWSSQEKAAKKRGKPPTGSLPLNLKQAFQLLHEVFPDVLDDVPDFLVLQLHRSHAGPLRTIFDDPEHLAR